MLDTAYEAWHADQTANVDTVLVAATNEEATALNLRARLDRVAVGAVEQTGIELYDGSRAGVGDWIVSRRNLRATSAGRRDFVKNGDRWRVHQTTPDNGMQVEHLGHRGRALLPSAYVERNVELAYAATAHRVQGATVDTSHVLVTDDTTRETLYVAASRARDRTMLYVATESLIEDDAERVQPPPATPSTVFAAALARTAAEQSATDAVRQKQDRPTTDAVRLTQGSARTLTIGGSSLL